MTCRSGTVPAGTPRSPVQTCRRSRSRHAMRVERTERPAHVLEPRRGVPVARVADIRAWCLVVESGARDACRPRTCTRFRGETVTCVGARLPSIPPGAAWAPRSRRPTAGGAMAVAPRPPPDGRLDRRKDASLDGFAQPADWGRPPAVTYRVEVPRAAGVVAGPGAAVAPRSWDVSVDGWSTLLGEGPALGTGTCLSLTGGEGTVGGPWRGTRTHAGQTSHGGPGTTGHARGCVILRRATGRKNGLGRAAASGVTK